MGINPIALKGKRLHEAEAREQHQLRHSDRDGVQVTMTMGNHEAELLHRMAGWHVTGYGLLKKRAADTAKSCHLGCHQKLNALRLRRELRAKLIALSIGQSSDRCV